MQTVRVSPTEVRVDALIYSFTDPSVADVFESCLAATGDIDACAKEQIAMSRRPADPGATMADVEPIRPVDNFDHNLAAGHNDVTDPSARLR